MTDYSALLSGSGGSPLSGAFGTPGAVAAKPSKKPPKRHGIGGFFQNLGDDIRDLQGVPAGIWGIGKSAVHDAKKATGFGGGAYQLDNVGRAAISSYTDAGTPTGEFGRSVLALLSGDGGGAARHYGKVWKSIYDAPLSPALDAAAAFTGGGAVAGKVAAKVAVKTGSERAARIAGLQRVGEITPSTVRGVSGPAGSFAAATRSIKDPLTGNVLHSAPVVRNPVVRGRKALVEKAYTKLPAASYMSPTRRGARLGEAQAHRVAARDAANIDKAYMSAFNKLDADEKDALVYIAQGFNTAERAQQLMKARTDRVSQKIAEHTGSAESPRKGAARKKAKTASNVADLLADVRVIERVLPKIEAPTPALVKAIEAQRAVNNATQLTFIRNLMREGKSLEEAEALIVKRAQMPLRKVGIEPADGEVPMILTHVIKKNASAAKDGAKKAERGQSLERGLTTKVLDEELATTGENWLDARYDRDASSVLQTHRLMFAKEQTHQRMERALAKAEPYDRAKHAAGIASGKLHWIKKNDQLVADMHYVDTSLDRIEKQIGDFTDTEIEDLRDAYGAMYDLIHSEGSPGVVLPKAHYNELVGQFSGGRGILQKITDEVGKLTKPWRHIVLSLKGSFYVNNFIGNMFLGVLAYGPRYILDVAHESLPAKLRGVTSERISSDVADMTRTTGAANVSQSKTAWWDVISPLGEKVSAKGALLTEDNFRRAAFRNNLRTSAAVYRKAHPGTTRHEAVEAIFNDKRAVDQLAEATYGDLLDYSKLTPVERELLLPLMPFWNFTRAMTGRTIRLTLDEPWKMRVLLAFGEHGIGINEDAMPDGVDLPGYLRGLVMLDPTGELPRILSTAGSNPLTAPVDLFAELMSIGKEGNDSPNILSSISPFYKVPLEALVNKDMFSGQEITAPDGSVPGGIGGRAWVQAQKNIPQWAMLQRYRYPSKYPAVIRDAKDTALQYAGVPVGDLSPENIASVAAISAYYDAQDKASQEKRRKEIAERARF